MIDQLEKEIHEGMLDLYQHQRMSKERESLVYFYFAGIHNENITLKEEIERLKQDNEYLNKVNIELSSRNSKAIEYIEEKAPQSLCLPNGVYDMRGIDKTELLNILKGVDKE